MWISIANPLRNCSTASNESAGDVRLAVEEIVGSKSDAQIATEFAIHSQGECEFRMPAKRLKRRIRLGCAVRIRIWGASEALET